MRGGERDGLRREGRGQRSATGRVVFLVHRRFRKWPADGRPDSNMEVVTRIELGWHSDPVRRYRHPMKCHIEAIVTHNVTDFEPAWSRFGIRILTPAQLLKELPKP